VEKILKGLRSHIKGELLFGDTDRLLYSTAACIFQIMPVGCVIPKDVSDLQHIVRYAYDNSISLTARGAGSAVAGQTLGSGIIIDFSKYMDHILEINQDQMYVRVQPGVVLGKLNRALAPYNLWFPPDPSSSEVATIGGMIANNSSGTHSLKYGATRDYILSLKLVLDNGELVSTDEPMANRRISQIYTQIQGLLAPVHQLIKQYAPETIKNSSGYHVYDTEGKLDLGRLIAGSEGTLALIAEAKLKVSPRPSERGMLRVCFADVESACETVIHLRELSPSALELVDKTMIDLVRGSRTPLEDLPEKTQVVLLVEFDGTEVQVREGINNAIAIIERLGALDLRKGQREQYERLWGIRNAASPILDRMKGPTRSMRIIEDGAVYPSRLVEYIHGLKQILAKSKVQGVIFGHAGSGNIHLNLILDPGEPGYKQKIQDLAEQASDLILGLKGTLSGEHGDGLLRTPYLKKMAGPVYPIFEGIKNVFDPKGILNPGKKIHQPGPSFTELLRSPYKTERLPPKLPVSSSILSEVIRCNGCGTCRTYCPIFTHTQDERTTPRAKARLFVAFVEGKADLYKMIDTGELERLGALCIDCKLCYTECPSLVDVPRACMTARAINAQTRGLPLRDRILAQTRKTSICLSTFWPIANTMLQNRGIRQFIESILGISKNSALPNFRRYIGITTKRAKRRLIYFPGCLAEFTDLSAQKLATVKVLEKNGFEVLIPSLRCCGIANITHGLSRSTIKDTIYNVTQLYRYVKQGYDIITSEPSCSLMLKVEYPKLLDLKKVREVSLHTYDVHEFLLKLYLDGTFNHRLHKIKESVVFHLPCHLRAQGINDEAVKPLSLIPGIRVLKVLATCCGMAGTFGLKVENRKISTAIFATLLDQIDREQPSLVISPCTSCKTQIASARYRVAHTTTLFSRAYSD
jgi:FAD/FMN-containing dehydrogenase/Fe-S oxidoreductase